MKIYLVRHGESVGNEGNFYQTPETPLTTTGKLQAKRVAKRLKGKGIELIYSSTHLRAMQTSEIISKEINVPIEPWGNLTELRRPKEFWQKSVDAPDLQKIEHLMRQNFGKKNWRYSNEENYEDLVKRAQLVITHLLEKHKDQTVLCISHGTFIKVIIAVSIFGDKLNPETMLTFRHRIWANNTGVSLLEHTETRGFRLLTWNDTSHL